MGLGTARGLPETPSGPGLERPVWSPYLQIRRVSDTNTRPCTRRLSCLCPRKGWAPRLPFRRKSSSSSPHLPSPFRARQELPDLSSFHRVTPVSRPLGRKGEEPWATSDRSHTPPCLLCTQIPPPGIS